MTRALRLCGWAMVIALSGGLNVPLGAQSGVSATGVSGPLATPSQSPGAVAETSTGPSSVASGTVRSEARLQLDLGNSPPPAETTPPSPEIRVRPGAQDVPSSPGSSEGALRPQADARTSAVEVTPEPAAFNGITPGQSTVADLLKQWGQPRSSHEKPPETRYLFEMPPFTQVEVIVRQQRVRSIVVRLEKGYPANLVAQHLELTAIRPVFISNPQGEILGQAFPERGVIFALAPAEQPGRTSNSVTDIILEELSADPFILRAETHWDSEPELAVRDLEHALKLDQRADRAWWLQARVQRLLGQASQALVSIRQAVQLNPQEVNYRLEFAQILLDNRQTSEAVSQLEQAVALAEHRPHVKARALCLLGDVHHAAEPPDFKKALEYHYEAIKIAQALRNDPYPAVRVAAKEVLVDAHLGAAKDIAWGVWEKKEVVINRWLERAEEFARDLVENERQPPRSLFKLAATALSVSVAVPQAVDVQPYLTKLNDAFTAMTEEVSPVRRAQLEWEYGTALYDAVQHFQARNQHDLAAEYGEKAAAAMDRGLAGHSPSAMDLYLLGRLYFRLGAIYGIQQKNHAQAVPIYDKALPHLAAAASRGLSDALVGRLGETYVSMAVSYWETGQKDKAVELTEQGLAFMEQGVQAKVLSESSLTVARANLKTMKEALQQTARAASTANTSESLR